MIPLQWFWLLLLLLHRDKRQPSVKALSSFACFALCKWLKPVAYSQPVSCPEGLNAGWALRSKSWEEMQSMHSPWHIPHAKQPCGLSCRYFLNGISFISNGYVLFKNIMWSISLQLPTCSTSLSATMKPTLAGNAELLSCCSAECIVNAFLSFITFLYWVFLQQKNTLTVVYLWAAAKLVPLLAPLTFAGHDSVDLGFSSHTFFFLTVAPESTCLVLGESEYQ